MSSNVLNLVSEEAFVAQTEKIVQALGGGGGAPFKLVNDIVNTIEVVNGTFTLQYEGEPPQGISEANITAFLPEEKKGVNVTNFVYEIQNIDTENKTITVTAAAQPDGVINGEVIMTAMLSDEDVNFLFPALVKVQGLPVDYKPGLENPDSESNFLTIHDKTTDFIIDLTAVNGFNCIVPNGVSPTYVPDSDELVAIAFVYGQSGEVRSEELSISGTRVTIPGGTLESGETADIYISFGDPEDIIHIIVN